MRSLKVSQSNYYLHIEKNRDGRSGVKIPIVFDLQRQVMKMQKSFTLMVNQEKEKKRLYDETASLITRQALTNKMDDEELHFLLDSIGLCEL